ncbi:MAG: 6-phosphogluconolactonase, partial [Bacillota bacterium]|nr:6-phosphogluconolactonase [Bacillota bacterium]
MIRVFETEDKVAKEIAAKMKEYLGDENPVFCLASGSTPEKSYKQFSEMIKGNSDIQKLKIVSLDEWVGIEKTSEGSCYQMLNKDLFSLVGLQEQQICFFDGTAEDLDEECSHIDEAIKQNPITFSLMGVGMNGHIGLNEPGSKVIDYSTVVDLSEKTKEVAQKYFNQQTNLEKGITIGLKQVIDSKRVIVAITGAHKAEIVKEIFASGEKTLPAQQLLGFDHIDFYLDAAAAKHLNLNQ